MRGIIELPLASGKKELTWYVGKADVAGTNNTNPVVQLRVNRDADFVAKRLWLVQYPNVADGALTLPAQTSVTLKDGGTQRGLSLVAGFNRTLINDGAAERAVSVAQGLPAPFLIRNNNNLFVDVVNPGAATVAWVGDLYLIAEGYKVYPSLAEDIPRTIKAYAIPYGLNTSIVVQDPAAAASNITQQIATITNNGEGKFLAKNFFFQAVDGAGNDVSEALSRALAFNFTDTTSGTKDWIQNQTRNAGVVGCPSRVLTVNNSFLPFNTPRLIDENGVIQTKFIFDAAQTAYLSGAATWPVTFSIAFNGALLPR